ncbi:MAG TPA: nucleotidyltransferase domain-containing protein [Methylomirabilota bacterium]|nr:nucleotidyltransferase domain-containing protein [Methylomirabilota bacterium]
MDVAAQRAAYVQRLETALPRVVEALATIPGVQRVSVFGSYARGRRDLFTDLDLLVVWETERPALDRLQFLYSRLDVPVDVDIVCYTPAELQASSDDPFIRRLLGEEVVLYEIQPR